MCVAGLYVANPCGHRWYQLVRSCHVANNLANCPEKIKLEGWESRTDSCPWCECDGGHNTMHESTHRLFGSTSSASSMTSSPTALEMSNTRSRRSDSDGTLSSISALSRHSSTASSSSDWGQRHRDMNERLHVYLNAQPHQVLPSAAKNYPTYPQAQLPQRQDSKAAPHDGSGHKRNSSSLHKRWKKSVQLSKDMLQGLTSHGTE